jgi:transposase
MDSAKTLMNPKLEHVARPARRAFASIAGTFTLAEVIMAEYLRAIPSRAPGTGFPQ